MAAILRSSVIQTVRRAFSGEGTLSVRALHTGCNNPMAYASCAKQNLKPAEALGGEAKTVAAATAWGNAASRQSLGPLEAVVNPLFKKIDDTARKELVVGYTERLVRELKLNPHLLDKAVYCLVSMSAVGTYMLGYQVGFNQSLAENDKHSAERKHDDLS